MKLRSALLASVLVMAMTTLIAPSASAETPPPGTPANAGKPTITGNPAQIGRPLTATKGAWYFVGAKPGTTGPSFTYQWLADGVPIAGATSAKYTPVANLFRTDLGSQLSVVVTAHKPGYAPQTATSAKTKPVIPGRFRPGKPSVSGSNTSAGTLTLDPGVWTPTPYSLPGDAVPNSGFVIRWYAGSTQVAQCIYWQDICGLIGSMYSPTSADIGKQIKVTVTAVRYGYVDMTRTVYAGYTKFAPAPA